MYVIANNISRKINYVHVIVGDLCQILEIGYNLGFIQVNMWTCEIPNVGDFLNNKGERGGGLKGGEKENFKSIR